MIRHLRTLSLCTLALSSATSFALAPNCASMAGSLYTDGTVAGWDPFGGTRCDDLFTQWKSAGLDAVTFVFEHHNFKLAKNDVVSEIPATTIPHASLVRCFSSALNHRMKINLKLQLPDTMADWKGEFRWRHYYIIDLAGEYYDRMISPYLDALLEATRAHDEAFPTDPPTEVRIIPLHELHVMLCSHSDDVEQMVERLRGDLRAEGRDDWKIGFSLDWQFFTDVTAAWDGDVHDVCLRQAPAVAKVMRGTDFVGVGAYKPSGGENGVIDNIEEGAAAFRDIYADATNTLAAYGLQDLPLGISEWNGGGKEPNSWHPPVAKPYKLAFTGLLNEWGDRDIRLDFFTFWNVRSSDKAATDALEMLSDDIKNFRGTCHLF